MKSKDYREAFEIGEDASLSERRRTISSEAAESVADGFE
ncbi:hypothetical protein A2U01_0006814 [Trifolium medium]|uniref:Uncharacterized protein n=1 Tax=Trifolium medium TaxID=97028 RepID=A0A392MF92_9FABA|nr:hypothetical protein [Trifolium medium]